MLTINNIFVWFIIFVIFTIINALIILLVFYLMKEIKFIERFKYLLKRNDKNEKSTNTSK